MLICNFFYLIAILLIFDIINTVIQNGFAKQKEKPIRKL